MLSKLQRSSTLSKEVPNIFIAMLTDFIMTKACIFMLCLVSKWVN